MEKDIKTREDNERAKRRKKGCKNKMKTKRKKQMRVDMLTTLPMTKARNLWD